jgi:competence protein ComEA
MPGAGLVGVLLLAAIAGVAAWRVARPVALPVTGRAVATTWPDVRLDLNVSSASELRTLPGIGPRLAERIVRDRTERGPYATVDALQRVDRIGPVLVERVRPWVVAGEESSTPRLP